MGKGQIAGISFAATIAALAPPSAISQTATFEDLQQGPQWTHAARASFYTTDQGSRMIPLAWLNGLIRANGQPFLADALARYGYLPNPDSPNGLPVGFTATGLPGVETVGMTCSACHTRQITINGQAYRVDGGPALVDFEGLLTDLDSAIGSVLASDAAFAPFAARALSTPAPDPDEVLSLRQDVASWYLRFHTLISRAMPDTPWGLGRLDAIGMIFDRLTGLDIGPPPSFIIANNIKKADAPARYPFLWNASRQDRTQWPGFAANGSDVLALGRNLGEVFGVFGVYEPKNYVVFVDYLNNNSANFEGLDRLEKLIKLIGPPQWQWPIDGDLKAKGEAIFNRDVKDGGCKECHDSGPGQVRFPLEQTLKTPITDAHTDTRELGLLHWQVKTGSLKGAYIPFVTKSPLGETDSAFNTLATSVVGSIAGHVLLGGMHASVARIPLPQVELGMPIPQPNVHLPRELRELETAFRGPEAIAASAVRPQSLAPPSADASTQALYESRVMKGIWAAAPYLHNGSVPTLVELLKPASQRVATFKVGPAYDLDSVGLAAEQPSALSTTRSTTDCSDLNSGNSRCGHDFGTRLTVDEKKALLEYLKSL